MPGSILNADINFPHFTGQETTDDKIDTIQNYLYMLYEQLRYSMGNLGVENFNDKSLEGLQKLITDPILMRLEGDDGLLTTLSVTVEGITSRLQDAEGNINALTITAENLESTISGKVDGSTVSSMINQSINGITLSVTADNDGQSTITLNKDGVEISSQEVYLNVNAAYIKGEVHADVINANSEIISPVIYSPDGGTYLKMDNRGGISVGTTSRAAPLLTLMGAANDSSTVSLMSYDSYGYEAAAVTLRPNTSSVYIGKYLCLSEYSYGSTLPTSGVQGQVFFKI